MAVQICLLAGHNKRGPEILAYVEKMQPGHEVRLVREPTNKFDKNAVQVHALDPERERVFIGFIAKVHNRRVAEWLDKRAEGYSGPALVTVFGYAGTGASKVPAIRIAFPDAEG
jgi:hypothetical protein